MTGAISGLKHDSSWPVISQKGACQNDWSYFAISAYWPGARPRARDAAEAEQLHLHQHDHMPTSEVPTRLAHTHTHTQQKHF